MTHKHNELNCIIMFQSVYEKYRKQEIYLISLVKQKLKIELFNFHIFMRQLSLSIINISY
ncbi:hypothetical protein PPBDW_I21443 [Photobacterium kishitanii]|nr:hypothetical protein PPBDW_I21443 [Photobacterium kishitanii]